MQAEEYPDRRIPLQGWSLLIAVFGILLFAISSNIPHRDVSEGVAIFQAFVGMCGVIATSIAAIVLTKKRATSELSELDHFEQRFVANLAGFISALLTWPIAVQLLPEAPALLFASFYLVFCLILSLVSICVGLYYQPRIRATTVAVFVVLFLVLAYMGTYYVLLLPPGRDVPGGPLRPSYGISGQFVKMVLEPAHRIDRNLRWNTWKLP